MKRRSVIVMALVILGLLASRAFAQTEDPALLSTEGEQAYKEALASWEHSADINKEIGLPPFGKEPERVDFSGFVAEQEANSKEITLIEAEKTAQWEKRLEEVRPYLRTLVKSGAAEPNDHRSTVARQEKEQLLRVADERWANRDGVERELNDIAARLGVERKKEIGNGRYAILAGEIDGEPIWIGSHNQFAAASISADELWPTNLTPWPSASTGLGLTGTNITLGMWEAEGYARESHHEFQGRVVQMDRTNGTSHFHATGVAGTMAASGHLFYTNFYGFAIRGVAFEAYVDAFDIRFFSSELADAAAGDTNAPGLRLSNHSWGTVNAWSRQSFSYYIGTNQIDVINGWVWNGLLNPLYPEDPKFGMYRSDQPDGTGCNQLDGFLSTNATRHLLVYSAGNDRFSGPQSNPPVYYGFPSTNAVQIFVSPGENDRDWISGDDDTYGFDTMSPPGTAKNVLTVGSVLDVFHVIDSSAYLGYTTNSPIWLSSFSAVGPTDDGRIKPDVMAVGQSNSYIRNFGIRTPDSDSDTGYQDLAGTSFAAPGVTAGLALSLQRRGQLFPDWNADIDDCRGSTLKALAIHTADNLWNPGPDYLMGWGLFNAVSAVRQIELDAAEGRGTHIKEIELAVGQTNSWLVSLDNSPFKVTAVWSDLPGNPSTNNIVDDPTPMLVNNLDIRVETENGTQTFMPWVLNPDLTNKSAVTRSAPATTGYDNRNNVEQVAIASPAPGFYRIIVTHSGGLPGGAMPGNQWVSVLSSGDTPLSPKVTQIEHSPLADECLIEFECDPGAYLHLETTTNLLDETSWELTGTLVAESWSNSVLPECDANIRFWRLRRETGE